MVCPEVDINCLSLESHFTDSDRQLIESIRHGVSAYQDFILNHGYTGLIDSSHVEEIIGTIIVSLIGRWQIYLKAFLKANKDLCESLFFQSKIKKVIDCNYLMTIITPRVFRAWFYKKGTRGDSHRQLPRLSQWFRRPWKDVWWWGSCQGRIYIWNIGGSINFARIFSFPITVLKIE